jgi:hypothetical protein
MSTGRLGAGDTAIQPTILDAKGDLIVATAADTPARLAVGSANQVLTVDSSTATGLKWATPTTTSITLTDYTPTLSNWTLGNGTLVSKWYDASSTLFYLYISIIWGSTSTVSGAIRLSFPATVAANAGTVLVYQGNIGKFCDVSASREYTCWVGGGSTTNMQFNLLDDVSYVVGSQVVDGTSPAAPATGDEFFVQGWYRKA